MPTDCQSPGLSSFALVRHLPEDVSELSSSVAGEDEGNAVDFLPRFEPGPPSSVALRFREAPRVDETAGLVLEVLDQAKEGGPWALIVTVRSVSPPCRRRKNKKTLTWVVVLFARRRLLIGYDILRNRIAEEIACTKSACQSRSSKSTSSG